MKYKIKYNRILIVDGSHLLHRVLSIPYNDGVDDFVRLLYKEIKDINYFPVVVFDGGISSRRLNINPNYKRCQEKKLLTENRPISRVTNNYLLVKDQLTKLLPLIGIPTIQVNNVEGDDLIYILSKLTKNSMILTDDKDLIQLIEKQPKKEVVIKRALHDDLLTIDYFIENKLSRQKFIAIKAILGDESDNIPTSCKEIGEKSVSNLYKLFLSLYKDNKEYPKTEPALYRECLYYNIPFNRQYINFNLDLFYDNLDLIDLTLVDNEITDKFIKEYILDKIHCKLNIKKLNLYLAQLHKESLFIDLSKLNQISNDKKIFLTLKNEKLLKDSPKYVKLNSLLNIEKP